ncbi:hypothetical protein PMIN01_05015 [Paraphaeosphaeria minitans]|uniref:Uncharacterized protein n=1 Tax=Paraphaeosphaeria minitans TaxID=565426 RepID=A0A9P6GL39_9PLEO|nr:hypothetical protein PMIN01_05015 [Paraphaeosphaeria minitans]
MKIVRACLHRSIFVGRARAGREPRLRGATGVGTVALDDRDGCNGGFSSAQLNVERPTSVQRSSSNRGRQTRVLRVAASIATLNPAVALRSPQPLAASPRSGEKVKKGMARWGDNGAPRQTLDSASSRPLRWAGREADALKLPAFLVAHAAGGDSKTLPART